MARAGTTQAKRARELARDERAQEKAKQRVERKNNPKSDRSLAPGEDPDLAGIVAGPQPIQDED